MAENAVDVLTSPLTIGESATIKGEDMVGFEDQAMLIKERLIGSAKQLDVVSIVGMPGLGKTTLARNVFNDPYIFHHFYIRAWITVSQVYQKRNLLLQSLNLTDLFYDKKDKEKDDKKDKDIDEKLSEELYKSLKGKRYLIVMDDIWDIGAWNDMKRCLPNDNNGSRVLFTSRLKEVALGANPINPPLELRFLSEDESWKLFLEKVFPNGICHSELVDVGNKILEKCQRLPLYIVVIGGLLANTKKTLNWWNQVAESLSSHTTSDTDQLMDTLALSYKHLPDLLKPCFLYFGAFPEDTEFNVSKLVWLWIAEGFIQRSAKKSLEEVADEHLQDLIDRSLILVSNKGSTGQIKSCRVHDLLHDFCRKKAIEEKFLEHIYKYEQLSSSSSSSSSSFMSPPRRLCMYLPLNRFKSQNPCSLDVCSLLLFNSSSIFPEYAQSTVDAQSICDTFRVLRVLDLGGIWLRSFPTEIAQLSDIRYIALHVQSGDIPDSISTLKHLETLIVRDDMSPFSTIHLPRHIWNVKTLRHLHVNRTTSLCCESRECNINLHPSPLENLQSLSTLELFDSTKEYSTSDLLRNTPNLKILRCILHAVDPIDFPSNLGTLKLIYESGAVSVTLPNLALSLKKVSLSWSYSPWSEMSKLGKLPNLEVLTLGTLAFKKGFWDLRDGEFLRLRVLKIDRVSIEAWNTTDNVDFPRLERLILRNCRKLESIPLSFGDIPTLQMIELRRCSESATNSAREIEEEQESNGNEQLKFLITN